MNRPQQLDKPTSPPTRIQSVERGCRLLLWFAEREEGATAKEAAFANRLALPTTYHLLNTLMDQGFLEKDDQRRYTLGQSSAVLARAYLRGNAVPGALLGAVKEVAERTSETAYLVEWGQRDIRVVASVEGTNVVRVAEVDAGPYEAAHARANGKVLLAHASPERRRSYLERHPLEPRTGETICDPGRFEQELALVRETGFASDCGEFAAGVSCVAAPIRRGHEVIASLGLSVPAERFAARRQDLVRDLLAVIEGIDIAAVEPAGPAAQLQEVGSS